MWHYRALKKTNPDGTKHYVVCEFYELDDKPVSLDAKTAWTGAITPTNETKKGLIEDLEMMLEDIKHYNAFTDKD